MTVSSGSPKTPRARTAKDPRPLTRTELATMLGVTQETVRSWVVVGCPREEDGRFLLARVWQWRLERETRKARRETEGTNPMQRKLTAEAAIKELQLRREEGAVITIEEHQEMIERISGGFAAVTKGRLARFERDIVQAKSAVDARLITDRMRVELLSGAQELAAELEAEAQRLLDAEARTSEHSDREG